MRATLCVTILLAASEIALAKPPHPSPTPVELTPAQAARLTAHTPKPEYLQAAHRRHMTGSGVFRLQVQPQTGTVSVVKVERSTGHAILDAAATDTLRRWRLRPNVMRGYLDPQNPSAPLIVRVPITFSM
jgi:TonB family protein